MMENISYTEETYGYTTDSKKDNPIIFKKNEKI